MIVVNVFVSCVLITFSLIVLLNCFTFPRLRPLSLNQITPSEERPAVSILIPARDEAAVIGDTVRGLLGQTGVAFEVLILDDGSTDGTADAARRAAAGDPRVRVLAGQPLPPGWLGKHWSCQQLAQAAASDRLLFTDADVYWRAGALAALLAEFERTRADLLTAWPTQLTETPGERLVVPLMALTIWAYLPVLATHHLPSPAFAAAIGQCLLFRRGAYQQVGQHAAVRSDIVDDMALARRVKAAGLRLRAVDAAGLIACRMYRSWPQVRDGYAKNILAGFGGSRGWLLAVTIFHWLVFVWPWLGLFAWPGLTPLERGGLLGLGALGIVVRALTAAATRQRVRDAAGLPLSVLLMTLIAARALWWQSTGGPRWKARRVGQPPDAAEWEKTRG